MHHKFAPILVLALALTAGCATTEDPRQGGLFGYNPDAYQRRVESRESQLQGLQQEQMQNQQTRGYLEQQRSQKEAQKQQYQDKIAKLDSEISAIQAKLGKVKLQTKAQQTKYDQVQAQLRSVKADIAKLKSATAPADDARTAEIKRLQKKLDGLLQEAEALSKM